MSEVAILAVVVVGFLLMLLEILVIPGFGVAGILGLLALGAGLTAAFLSYGPVWGGVLTVGAVVVVGAMLWLAPRSRAGKAMVLGSDQAGGKAPPERPSLLGSEGHAITPLRPAGVVRIGDEEVDAVTGGEFIERGAAVRVVQIEGVRVVVEATSTETPTGALTSAPAREG